MATLFERLTGVNLPIESDEKLPWSAFKSLIYERNRGAVTGQYIATALSLTPAQITDAQRIVTAIQAASNKQAFISQLDDLLTLAELSRRSDVTLTGYDSEASFWARVEA